MNSRKEGLCRIEDHWCTECCEGRNCANLGELLEDEWGCLGYNLDSVKDIETVDGLITIFPQLPFCGEVDCLEGSHINREIVKQTILNQPPGEFFMSVILEMINSKMTI